MYVDIKVHISILLWISLKLDESLLFSSSFFKLNWVHRGNFGNLYWLVTGASRMFIAVQCEYHIERTIHLLAQMSFQSFLFSLNEPPGLYTNYLCILGESETKSSLVQLIGSSIVSFSTIVHRLQSIEKRRQFFFIKDPHFTKWLCILVKH